MLSPEDTRPDTVAVGAAGEIPAPPQVAATVTPQRVSLEPHHAGVRAGRVGPPSEPDSDHDPEPEPDLENLAPVTSGPAYSVFSKRMKLWIVIIMSISGSVSPMTAHIYFPALNTLADAMGVNITLINLTLTTYMVFQAIGPLVFGDLADVNGRRPAFIICFSIYAVANIGLALQNHYAALLTLRMLQSFGSGGTLALSYAVVADISVSAERGSYMGFVSAGMNIGPTLGPVIGGILAEYLGWRAIFWFCAILSVSWLIPFTLTIPETCRRIVGNGSGKPPSAWNMTMMENIRRWRSPRHSPPNPDSNSIAESQRQPNRKLTIPNPFATLKTIREVDMALLLFFSVLIYLVFILTVSSLTTQFYEIYGLTDLQLGLCFIPYGLGCTISSFAQGPILDTNYRRIAKKIGFTIDLKRGDDLANFPIERARIQPIIPILLVGCAATVGYGWALHFEAPLPVALALLFVIGVAVMGPFSMTMTLAVDLYPHAPATAIAAQNFLRCIFGAGAIGGIDSMIRAMGRGWCFTFWGLLCAACMPMLLLIQKNGMRWRAERRERLAREKAAKEEREERERQERDVVMVDDAEPDTSKTG